MNNIVELELLSRQPKKPITKTPILFVHGAWHGAWCWDQGFLDYFADCGFPVYALSLRAHGKSGSDKPLRKVRIRDYVEDVRRIAESLPSPPILVGHSMGGAVVQKCLQQGVGIAGVLMASMPPSGVFRTALNTHLQWPLAAIKTHLTRSLFPLVAEQKAAVKLFFNAELPEQTLQEYHAQLQDESYAAFLDMLIFDLPKPSAVTQPILVLGAADDMVFSVSQIQATAKAYNTEAVIFNNMAHDMMLEPNWHEVADVVIDWCMQFQTSSRPN